MGLPRHLAIIMDGNGRWAQKRHRPRVFGHIKGAVVARQIIEECTRLEIQYLTLYAFSTENWKRPDAEVAFLMKLLKRHLQRERKKLLEQNIRFRVLGDTSKLPPEVVRELEITLKATENNTGMTLVFALNYGGRQEILAATRALAKRVQTGELKPDEITESLISQSLQGSFMPDPDLIIRTSGEFRLSNFLTWQSSYSELYVTPQLWPDFDAEDLRKALEEFSRRDRRFGAITDSKSKPEPKTLNPL